MAIESTDIFMAARLIQWGLQPKIRPVQQQEYRELIRQYMNRSEFQMIVREMSDGLGLYVLNVTEHGIVLSPREESVFRMKASDFRPSSTTSDTRLLDGLVEITIAATVFPRERDLDDDVNRPRPPVTIDEIEEQLRSLCDKLAEKFKEVDPAADDMETGLYDAWRVYANTMSARETKDNRQASRTTRRIIEYNLTRLKEFGCFTEARYNGKPAWQPTRRYNVLVTELAAFRLYSEVTDILNKDSHASSDASSHEEDLASESFDASEDTGWADDDGTFAQSSAAEAADNAESRASFSDAADGFEDDEAAGGFEQSEDDAPFEDASAEDDAPFEDASAEDDFEEQDDDSDELLTGSGFSSDDDGFSSDDDFEDDDFEDDEDDFEDEDFEDEEDEDDEE